MYTGVVTSQIGCTQEVSLVVVVIVTKSSLYCTCISTFLTLLLHTYTIVYIISTMCSSVLLTSNSTSPTASSLLSIFTHCSQDTLCTHCSQDTLYTIHSTHNTLHTQYIVQFTDRSMVATINFHFEMKLKQNRNEFKTKSK